MSHLIDIIIPTFDNPQYLYPCVQSLLAHQTTSGLCKVTVVNNGHPDSLKGLPDFIDVVQMPENRHWTGGLKAGIEKTSAPFIVLCNDDIFIPPGSRLWPNKLLQHFIYPDCAAVGPSSNFAMGTQGIWGVGGPTILRVPFLIGFFLMVKRDILEKAGGIDETFRCGDDLDLSMRLRALGKYLVCDKEVFIFHHGAKTGARVEGSYWYSAEQQEKTWESLFRKHGVKKTSDMVLKPFDPGFNIEAMFPAEDPEGKVVSQYVQGEKVVELGCGDKKTVPHAIGVDAIPKGQMIPHIAKQLNCIADVNANVQDPLPFAREGTDCIIARHILEHMVDPVEALRNWSDILKQGGRIIVAVPDQNLHNTIPMNSEHVHAFTEISLRNLMRVCGFKEVDIKPSGNNISLVGVFEKNGKH